MASRRSGATSCQHEVMQAHVRAKESQRVVERKANWTGGTGAVSGQPRSSLQKVILTSPSSPSGAQISVQLQNDVLKKELSFRLLGTFYFKFYFSAAAAR